MKKSAPQQADFFEVPLFNTLPSLIERNGRSKTIIIGCGKRKKKASAPAKSLYISDRFTTCVKIAENLAAPYAILSARHGVVLPETELAPYDLDISMLEEEARSLWAESAAEGIGLVAKRSTVTLLAQGDYADLVLAHNSNRKKPLNIVAPLRNIHADHVQDWLDQALKMSVRVRDLRALYLMIEEARHRGETFLLRDLRSRNLPNRAVYVFLDSTERNFTGQSSRIVRIGTHAVSLDSKATLRNRLRNHLGKADGSGNHRGSIFRLHVGSAILARHSDIAELPSWGNGEHASKLCLELELEHEKRVSEYLGKLEVFIIPIDDAPSKDSLRAHVETQLIALLTEGMQSIDKPSSTWLGSDSPMQLIAESGLWNLRDVGKPYEENGPGSVKHIARIYSKFNDNYAKSGT